MIKPIILNFKKLIKKYIQILPLAILGFFFIIYNFISINFYWWLEQEDGVNETIQFFLFLFAAYISFCNCKSAYKYHKKWLTLILIFSFALLFIAFEEISWGQRIFQIESSDWFIENNSQQEITIHNITPTGKLSWLNLHDIFIIIGFYGGLAFLIFPKNENPRNIRNIIVPKKKYSLYFLPTGVFYFYFEYINKLELYVIGSHQEVVELILSLGFLFLALDHKSQIKTLNKDQKNF